MRIEVNGEAREVAASIDVAALLVTLGHGDGRVAVELNRAIAPRSAWGATVLKAGDRVEIVAFVGGG